MNVEVENIECSASRTDKVQASSRTDKNEKNKIRFSRKPQNDIETGSNYRRKNIGVS